MGGERTALILYGSETGSAQDVAEELGRLCERLRFATTICELNSVKISQLIRSSLVLISISTTGQGELPANSQSFWKAIRSVRLPPNCLRSVQFASFGLGDSSYPKFNWAHRKLYNRLVQLGARAICERGESDEQHPEGLDGLFVPWTINLRKRLLEEYSLPDGIEPIPDDVVIEPKWILQLAYNQTSTQSTAPLDSEEPPIDLVSVPGGLTSTIESNKRVTADSHFQDTRLVSLKIPGHHGYTPGATLTIYSKNFPSDINEFISLMSWDEIADKPLAFVSTRPANSITTDQPPISLPQHYQLTLRILLTNYLDIMSIPRRSFFAHLMQYTTDEMYVERLKEFLSPDLIDELYDYTTRPRRSILEVLSDFHSVKLPWQKICSIIPLMRGRQFSIASGGELKTAGDGSTRVDLLVALVKYRTIMKRIRYGVATRYIATLKPGQEVTVTLQKGGLNITKSDIYKPVVMVSPGTGIAPMRSLIWERKMQREHFAGVPQNGIKDVLFFGCRNKGVDDYFKEEWALEDLRVDVHTAYSREQKQKLYVQDLTKEHGAAVFEALAVRGGLVFVCGSSGRMPQAVRNALIEVFQTQGGMAMADAEAYLAKMEKDGRYKQETW